MRSATLLPPVYCTFQDTPLHEVIKLLIFLLPANEVWYKVMFYTCLSFCSWEDVCSIVCPDTSPRHTSPLDTPRTHSLPWHTAPPRYYGIWSTNGRYAFYWNAYLLTVQYIDKSSNPLIPIMLTLCCFGSVGRSEPEEVGMSTSCREIGTTVKRF